MVGTFCEGDEQHHLSQPPTMTYNRRAVVPLSSLGKSLFSLGGGIPLLGSPPAP